MPCICRQDRTAMPARRELHEPRPFCFFGLDALAVAGQRRPGCGGGAAALAEGFVEHDRSGGGDVEGADAAGHGNAQQVVAGAADQIVEAGAFAAEDEDAVAGEVELVVVGWPRSSSPMTQRFWRLSSSRARTRLTTRAMRRCSAAPALALTATGLRGAERRSVRMTPSTPAPSATRSRAPRFCGSSTPSRASSRRAAPGWRSAVEEVFDGEEFLRADEGDDALMGGGLGEQRQLLAGFLADADAGLAAERRPGVPGAVVVAFAGHQNVVKAALAGLERFLDRMQAVENFHEG